MRPSLLHKTVFVWSDLYYNYSFPDDHPFKSIRESLTKKFLDQLGLFHEIKQVEPDPIDEEVLLQVHSKDYINVVKRMSERGHGMLDDGDTPAFRGIYEASLARVAGNLKALKEIESGNFVHAINIGGGLHHAKRSSAGGFCVFNDIAIVAKEAEKKYNRIVILDIDGHHFDGTQSLLYDDDKSLKISMHMYHANFFPGSGSVNEVGEGKGKGFTINVPLPPGTGDDAYIMAFDEIVYPAILRYKPDLIVLEVGGDSHFGDPLVELKLSTNGYLHVVRKVHELAHQLSDGRLIMTGGGGYNYDATARVWTLSIAEIAGIKEMELETLHDCCGTASTPFVMEKVKKVIEQLKEIHNIS
ncbi:acetoin utilization protein AcuC [Sulfuracidifex metallicus]|uniref:Acetoin utilization protein AcuC n=1 Tax=Sulfuracidifex metallicus DSM 6482 = JCM 9184 TaxID=523847 RepID=A0A6A9QNT0_SULME|nr:acetoin utilization protein AcuC [Sulfuracidifex metallicus]MUN28831.1 acetoin utilization protein AcuC [Sulfuracidifex metallicus DSM 6482 = JCM 9184]WOE50656.1 acetoin utilization protein AcuC [Sulfuracidifex metallicus DSM 6482 = JCM 9184]